MLLYRSHKLSCSSDKKSSSFNDLIWNETISGLLADVLLELVCIRFIFLLCKSEDDPAASCLSEKLTICHDVALVIGVTVVQTSQ